MLGEAGTLTQLQRAVGRRGGVVGGLSRSRKVLARIATRERNAALVLLGKTYKTPGNARWRRG